MGQSHSNLLATISEDDMDTRLTVEDTLTTYALLAESKRNAFFGDVHYESSIEGDVLLPLDKVVSKGWNTYCNISPDSDAVEKEMDDVLGDLIRPDVLHAIQITVSRTLGSALAEARQAAHSNWAERRWYAMAVGHLGGICSSHPTPPHPRSSAPPPVSIPRLTAPDRLNYLLHVTTPRSPALATALPSHLGAAWALSSVRLDYLPLNAVNVAIEQSFAHAVDEGHASYGTRVAGIKDLALQGWDDDQVREAAVERRKRRVGREDDGGKDCGGKDGGGKDGGGKDGGGKDGGGKYGGGKDGGGKDDGGKGDGANGDGKSVSWKGGAKGEESRKDGPGTEQPRVAEAVRDEAAVQDDGKPDEDTTQAREEAGATTNSAKQENHQSLTVAVESP